MQQALVTIVVVTQNNLVGLERTMASLQPLASLARHPIDVLVIDGGSNDGTVKWLQAVKWHIRFISEPDDGIYDAMNKGIERGIGSYMWFLNAGDQSLIDDLTYEAIADMVYSWPIRPVLMFDYLLCISPGHDVQRRARRAVDLWHALPTSHQAIWYPTGVIRSHRYPPHLKLCGDYWITAMTIRSAPARNVRLTAVRFFTGGVSTGSGDLIGGEAALVQSEVLKLPRLVLWISRVRHRAAAAMRILQIRRASRESRAR